MTIHAGEYLVGSFIEERYPNCDLWVPSKDTGIDLLVTNARKTRMVALQVKFSKDFLPTQHPAFMQSKLSATGWWTLQEKKIKDSKADFWVFVLPSFTEYKTHFIIISPGELLRRFRAIYSKSQKRLHLYLTVTKAKKCWDTRDLSKANQHMIAYNEYIDKNRDFTQFLDNWSEIEKRLRK